MEIPPILGFDFNPIVGLITKFSFLFNYSDPRAYMVYLSLLIPGVAFITLLKHSSYGTEKPLDIHIDSGNYAYLFSVFCVGAGIAACTLLFYIGQVLFFAPFFLILKIQGHEIGTIAVYFTIISYYWFAKLAFDRAKLEGKFFESLKDLFRVTFETAGAALFLMLILTLAYSLVLLFVPYFLHNTPVLPISLVLGNFWLTVFLIALTDILVIGLYELWLEGYMIRLSKITEMYPTRKDLSKLDVLLGTLLILPILPFHLILNSGKKPKSWIETIDVRIAYASIKD